MASERVLVAQIGAAHGLKGEVKLVSFTPEPLAIAELGPLDTEEGDKLIIAHIRQTKSSVIARFKGIEDRSEAEKFKNKRLYVARDALPALAEGSYYHADLIGLEVRDAERPLGSVARVVNYGAGDLLEVEEPSGSKTLFVPFAGAQVDLEEGVIRVELPEGFLEEGGE